MSRKIAPVKDVVIDNNESETDEVTTKEVPNLTAEEQELFHKFTLALGIKGPNEHGKYCFEEEGVDAAYGQFEVIQLGAIDIMLCPDKSLISRKFTSICIMIKSFEYLLMYYSFKCVPISNNPFLNGFQDTSTTSGITTYSPLSVILIFTFVWYVCLSLLTGLHNSMLLVTTKDFEPKKKNWKYTLKHVVELLEIGLLVSLCFFSLSTYIYEYDLELIFNGMAVIFIAEFDEMSVDLYLHGNEKRAVYYHKLICLSYVKDNYICTNDELKEEIKNIEDALNQLKQEKNNKATKRNNKKMSRRLVRRLSKKLSKS